MSTGDGYGRRCGRNCEFCVAVGPVTRTAGSLTESVKDAGCLSASKGMSSHTVNVSWSLINLKIFLFFCSLFLHRRAS